MSHVQDGSVATASSASSITPSISGVTSGNLLICYLAWSSSTQATVATPTGWSLGYSSAGHGNSTNGWAGTAVFFKSGAPSGSNSCAMTLPNSTSSGKAVISEFSGYADPVTVNVTALNGGGNNINSLSIGPSSTTTVANAVVAYVFCQDENDAGTTTLGISTPGTGTTNALLNNDNTVNVGCRADWKERTSTGTESATWTWTPANQGVGYGDGSLVIFASSPSVVPYQPAVQPMTLAPASVAPLLRVVSAAATALAVVAGTYVPIGTNATQLQSQVAYREAARLTAQPKPPVATAGTTVIYLGPPPVLTPVVEPPWPYESAQPFFVYSPGVTPPYLGPPPVLTTVPEPPWPYAQLETWRVQPEPGPFGGITAIYLGPPPTLVPVVEPPWPYAATLIPAPTASEWAQTANYYGAVPTLIPVREPDWPYAATLLPAPTASEWGQTVSYTGALKSAQITQAPWPYASAVALSVGAATNIAPATQVPFAPLAAFAQQAWPYANTQIPVYYSAGITSVYAGAVPVPQLGQVPWPYASATTVSVGAATNIAPATQVPYGTPFTPIVQPWPYARQQINLDLADIGVLTGPQAPPPPVLVPLVEPPWSYVTTFIPAPTASEWSQQTAYALSPTLVPVREPDWPYASTALPASTASEWAQSASYAGAVPTWQIEQQPWPYWLQQPIFDLADIPSPALPWTSALVPVRVADWPYAATLLGAPSASEWGQVTPGYFGLSPVSQWLSYPPWPYAGTMLSSPTASEWGAAPPPPPVNQGASALRRWVVQQYLRDFEQREQATKKKTEPLQKAVAKRQTRREVITAAQRDGHLDAAMRIAAQVSAGQVGLTARVVTLEQARKLDLPPLPKVRAPERGQHAADDDDLLLLAILFNEGN